MSEHDLQVRLIYHHTRESIETHLRIVFDAMAVSHCAAGDLITLNPWWQQRQTLGI